MKFVISLLSLSFIPSHLSHSITCSALPRPSRSHNTSQPSSSPADDFLADIDMAIRIARSQGADVANPIWAAAILNENEAVTYQVALTEHESGDDVWMWLDLTHGPIIGWRGPEPLPSQMPGHDRRRPFQLRHMKVDLGQVLRILDRRGLTDRARGRYYQHFEVVRGHNRENQILYAAALGIGVEYANVWVDAAMKQVVLGQRTGPSVAVPANGTAAATG